MSDDVESVIALVQRIKRLPTRAGEDAIEARDRLIAKRERERCARVCDGVSKQARDKEEALGLDRIHERNAELAQALGALECRDAIRALPDEDPSK